MRHFLTALFLLVPGFAGAQSVQDQILSQLTAQGFTRIEVSRTLLGRVKIEARSASLDRELVFNPVTGEILRDYWQDNAADVATPRVLVPGRDRDDKGGRAVAATSSGKSGSSGGRGDDDRSGRGGRNDDRNHEDRSGSHADGSDDDSDRRGGGDDHGNHD